MSASSRTHDPPSRRAGASPSRSSRSRRSALRPRLTRRQQIYAALVVAVLVVAGLLVWFTPLMAVREVQVQGLSSVSQGQVLTALDVPTGTPLLRVDLTAAAARVARLPRVARATVDRHYPSELTVSVTERVPMVFVNKPDGNHLLDATGVDFATAPPTPGVPRLVLADPSPNNPLTKAALAVVGALPDAVRTQVDQVAPASVLDVRLILARGRTVLWGAPDDLAHKGAVLAALLSQPGKTYDVSSPDLPTIS
jgi:cell division protein FtsQ